MSIKLDELRKRLLMQQSQGEAGPAPESAAAPMSLPEAESRPSERPQPASEPKMLESSKSSEPTVVKTIEIGSTKERERGAAKAESQNGSNGNGNAAARTNVTAIPKLEAQATQDLVAESVAKLFEQTKTFQVRFDELAQAIDLIERMADSAGRLFGPLRNFHAQLAQLAASFESMRAFQAQLAQLGKTFEPMRLLHDQLSQLSDGLQTHLAQLVKALDPAKDFRDRIMTLARSLDEATELQAEFGELYNAFRSGNANADGAKPAAEPRRAVG